LADFYKCDYKFFISNERVAPIEQTEALFRRYSDELQKTDRWAIQEILFLAECEHFLEQNLGRQKRDFPFVKQGGFYKGHGIEAASSLRRFLGYSSQEVRPDIYSDFRSIGIHVFRRRLINTNISGLYIKHPVAGRCILVNYKEDPYRQRFTAAHEAAHAILDADQDSVMSFENWGRENLREIRANTFASRYLVPPQTLDTIPEPNRWDVSKIKEWSARFNVNTTVFIYALQENNFIDREQTQKLIGHPISEDMKSDPELPTDLSPKSLIRRKMILERGISEYYAKLCFEAYRSGVISVARIAEMMLINRDELYDIATSYKERLLDVY
jgi:Zn-dependent peptidase ImmA (M78 family)